MGAKEGAQILDLVQRLKDAGNVSMIMIVHNYIQVFQVCDRVNLIQDGVVTFDKPTSRRASRSSTRSSSSSTGARARRRWRQKRRRPQTARRNRLAAVRGGPYAIGVDFGTESGRALLLDARTGERARGQRRRATRAR